MAAAGTFSLKTEYQKRLGRHRQSDAAEWALNMSTSPSFHRRQKKKLSCHLFFLSFSSSTLRCFSADWSRLPLLFFHPSAIYSQLIRSTSSNCKCLQRKKGNENQRNDPISSHGDYRPRRHIFHWKILSTMHHPFFFQSQQWIIPNQQSPIVIGQPVAKKGANGLRSFVRVDQASYKMDAIKPL